MIELTLADGNNCHCKDTVCSDEKCFAGDVQATLDFGFGSIKLDGCGVEKNITLFSELFNKSGVPVMLENCHNGNPTYPTSREHAPFNFFRSSTDIRPTFGSVLSNLQTTLPFNSAGITGRWEHGATWAYPDMLEVGVTNSQHPGLRTLNLTEARTHFGAWCIVSSPLVLGFDLTDNDALTEVWDIIANTEAIAVNQAWASDAGVLIANATTTNTFDNCHWGQSTACTLPSWQVWRKTLPGGAVAVLLMNNGRKQRDVSVAVDATGVKCGAGGCAVRDVWAHTAGQPVAAGSTVSRQLGPSDSAFLVLTPKAP